VNSYGYFLLPQLTIPVLKKPEKWVGWSVSAEKTTADNIFYTTSWYYMLAYK